MNKAWHISLKRDSLLFVNVRNTYLCSLMEKSTENTFVLAPPPLRWNHGKRIAHNKRLNAVEVGLKSSDIQVETTVYQRPGHQLNSSSDWGDIMKQSSRDQEILFSKSMSTSVEIFQYAMVEETVCLFKRKFLGCCASRSAHGPSERLP